MWSKRGQGGHGNDVGTGDSQRAATPGKRTLTEALPPVQRKPGPLGDIAQPVQRKASGDSGADVVAAAQRGVSGSPQALPHGDRIQSPRPTRTAVLTPASRTPRCRVLAC
jgi:hypothetical protein